MDMQKEYLISDLARIFPDMPPEDFARLVASIREDGLMDPITVWRGQVIDGRHRSAACAEAGVERRFECLDDDADPLRYILARNDLRRHLDDSRRAVVAHKLSGVVGPRTASQGKRCKFAQFFYPGGSGRAPAGQQENSEDSPAAPAVRLAVSRDGSRSAMRRGSSTRPTTHVNLRAICSRRPLGIWPDPGYVLHRGYDRAHGLGQEICPLLHKGLALLE